MRKQDFSLPTPIPQAPRIPPWREKRPSICAYHFCCRGKWGHPLVSVQKQGGTCFIADCGGVESHSLPLRGESAGIYPVLIDLLNDLEMRSGHRIAITSGHCCPEHHAYIDPQGKDPKHMIGAAVDFYFEGVDVSPQQLLQWIAQFLPMEKQSHFMLNEKKPGDCSSWQNRELLIKHYGRNEGRNGDNLHSHPYFCIQVLWDRTTGKKVSYTWKEAHEQYYRF